MTFLRYLRTLQPLTAPVEVLPFGTKASMMVMMMPGRFSKPPENGSLCGGNSNIFGIFNTKIGEDEPILTHIFQMGWFNHQLVQYCRIAADGPSDLVVVCYWTSDYFDSFCTSEQPRTL